MITEKKRGLENVVNSVHSILVTLEVKRASGEIKLDEAKSSAIQMIKNLRYGPRNKDYIWINDFRPFMIMHPYIKELDGTDVSNYKDKKGKKLFIEL